MLDKYDRSGITRLHLRMVFISGMGFLTDAYDLFVLSTALPILVSFFGITASHNIFSSAQVSFLGLHISSVTLEEGLLGSIALFGAFIGAFVFGRMADRFGRKVMYVVDLSIMTAFALISAFSSSVPMLMASRFFLGMGIGGDYPVSSTLMSEYSGIRHRGKLVSMVFAMQGFGLLLGAMVGVLSVAFLPLGVAWRVMLGAGAVPSAAVIYFRSKVDETPRFRVVSSERPEAREKVRLSRYWLPILGTAGSWFLFDMAFYGTSINNGLVLSYLGYGTVVGNIRATILNIAIGNALIASVFSVPGYWIAVGTIDRVGRKTLQWLGFSVMAAVYFIIATHYRGLLDAIYMFIALYGVSFLFGNIGPNTTTFILPTELFPTEIRTTGHGIASGSAKFGAGLFTLMLPSIMASMGVPNLMLILGSISVAGMVLTLFAIKETKNERLEETSSLSGYGILAYGKSTATKTGKK